MEIKPIRSDEDYQATLKEIEALMGDSVGEAQEAKLDLLVTLVEAYEDKHHPIGLPDPIEAILFMMEQKNLTRQDLEPAIGGRGRVAEILNRRRPLTLAMIRRLMALLELPADILVQPYSIRKAA